MTEVMNIMSPVITPAEDDYIRHRRPNDDRAATVGAHIAHATGNNE